MKRVKEIANIEFVRPLVERLAEDLAARCTVMTPYKERVEIIKAFLEEKKLTGELNVIE